MFDNKNLQPNELNCQYSVYALFLFIVNWRRWSLDLELTPESPGGNKGGGGNREGGNGNRVMDGATYWNELETTGCYFHY